MTAQIGGHDLVGARLTAVGGIPIKQVLAQVKPLVPHDNETSGVKNFRPMYLLSKEVLEGSGSRRGSNSSCATGSTSNARRRP